MTKKRPETGRLHRAEDPAWCSRFFYEVRSAKERRSAWRVRNSIFFEFRTRLPLRSVNSDGDRITVGAETQKTLFSHPAVSGCELNHQGYFCVYE
ncbi:hypothetical protein [Eubacterium pyruvativorans]|uniref:hypothetical protein n=1 Tax=Eubacterium pyruvativorans TaxID=155865 RepID=UPI003F8C4141